MRKLANASTGGDLEAAHERFSTPERVLQHRQDLAQMRPEHRSAYAAALLDAEHPEGRWDSILTAPKAVEVTIGPDRYGAFIDVQHPDGGPFRARWRHQLPNFEVTAGYQAKFMGSWRDEDDKPLRFQPKLWWRIP